MLKNVTALLLTIPFLILSSNALSETFHLRLIKAAFDRTSNTYLLNPSPLYHKGYKFYFLHCVDEVSPGPIEVSSRTQWKDIKIHYSSTKNDCAWEGFYISIKDKNKPYHVIAAFRWHKDPDYAFWNPGLEIWPGDSGYFVHPSLTFNKDGEIYIGTRH